MCFLKSSDTVLDQNLKKLAKSVPRCMYIPWDPFDYLLDSIIEQYVFMFYRCFQNNESNFYFIFLLLKVIKVI